MISGCIEVNKFAYIRLILEEKFGDNSSSILFSHMHKFVVKTIVKLTGPI